MNHEEGPCLVLSMSQSSTDFLGWSGTPSNGIPSARKKKEQNLGVAAPFATGSAESARLFLP